MSLDVDIPDALASAIVPVAAAQRVVQRPALRLDVVGRKGLDVSIGRAVTGGDMERTMDGASTLSLTLHDPHRALLRNPDLAKAIDMQFAGYWWRLVKVSKSGDDLTLTFEDRDVAYLRQHSKPRAMARNKVTRAQFIRTLVREVGQRPAGRSKNRPVGHKRIVFVCPELRVRQPIGKAPTRRTKRSREADRAPGISSRDRVKVKTHPATAEQRRNGERALDVADTLNAGPKATLALMEAVIIESQIRNLTYGLGTSLGILQVQADQHTRAVATSVEKSVHLFLTQGFTGAGGAMDLARKHPGWSAAEVAAAVQGPKNPVYHTVRDEAQKWVDAYGGASGTDTGGSSRTDSARSRKRYQFRRGEPGKPEDSWTAIQRLASEVGWHAFMDRGRLYYVSDDWLRRQKPRYVIDENDDGVQGIDFDVDTGRKVTECTVTARAAMTTIPVGSLIRLRECGVADGRYIVHSVRQAIYDNAVEISLRAPTPKLPEPAGDTVSAQGSASTVALNGAGTLREKIVAVAEASLKSYSKNPGAWFYSQPGAWNTSDPTHPPKRGNRSDCSQWIAAVYKRAGAPAPGPNYNGISTANMRVKGREVSLSQARAGDIILYGPPPSHHVELFVGPGTRTIGHGSPPVAYHNVGMFSDGHCWRYNFLDD